MLAIHLVTLLACSLAAVQDNGSSEDTSPDLLAVIPRSLKARPLGRSGYDDVYAPLLPPIQFPFHYALDELPPFQLETMDEKKLNFDRRVGKTQESDKSALNKTSTPWFDLSATVARSIVDPVRIPELRFTTPPPMDKGPTGNAEFLKNSFFLKGQLPEKQINWTTCEEFSRNAYFHPKGVTDHNWVPFYVWSTIHMPAGIHRFIVPTKKVVESYRSNQERFFNFTMDWTQPKLMHQQKGTEVLLVALDRRGRFRALPWIDGLDEASVMRIRPMTVHLKIRAPYLVHMHCEMHHATVMAAMGTGPKSFKQKTLEADAIGFVGEGYPVGLWKRPPRRKGQRS